MKHPVGQTQNGLEVYVQLPRSKVGKSISRQPRLLTLAQEMLAAVKLRGPEICMEYDMHRQIGYDFIINTSDTDAVFYARLSGESVYTRFIKNGTPIPSSYLTIIVRQDSEKNYELIDVWIGHQTPPLPGCTDETSESKPYWAAHALIFGDQPLHTQTLTKTCPY